MPFSRPLWGLTVAILILAGCQEPGVQTPQAAEDDSPEAMVELGRYIVNSSGCSDCHTPKTFSETGVDFDRSRWLSGHPEDAGIPDSLPFELSTDPGGWGAVGTNHQTAWGGPWGISFGINLTPDQETGIGSWTEEMFVNAFRTGKHQGTGRNILPPMPWPLYREKTDRDLKAMFAYLQSLPPIRNAVPEPIPIEDLR